MAVNKTAGLFDIRNVIGSLLSIYGVILLLMGIFGDEQGQKTGNVNANLWSGLILLVVGIIFIFWARAFADGCSAMTGTEAVAEVRREEQ